MELDRKGIMFRKKEGRGKRTSVIEKKEANTY